MPYSSIKIESFKDGPVIPIHRDSKIAFLSDLHLNTHTTSEKDLFLGYLLAYYQKSGFHVVLLGDTENSDHEDLDKIIETHPNTYQILNILNTSGHLLKIAGNHDQNQPKHTKHLPMIRKALFKAENFSILALHGHQSSVSDKVIHHSHIPLHWLYLICKETGTMFFLQWLRKTHQQRIMKRMNILSRRLQTSIMFGHTHQTIFGGRLVTDAGHDDLDSARSMSIKNPVTTMPTLFNPGALMPIYGLYLIELRELKFYLMFSDLSAAPPQEIQSLAPYSFTD